MPARLCAGVPRVHGARTDPHGQTPKCLHRLGSGAQGMPAHRALRLAHRRRGVPAVATRLSRLLPRRRPGTELSRRAADRLHTAASPGSDPARAAGGLERPATLSRHSRGAARGRRDAQGCADGSRCVRALDHRVRRWHASARRLRAIRAALRHEDTMAGARRLLCAVLLRAVPGRASGRGGAVRRLRRRVLRHRPVHAGRERSPADGSPMIRGVALALLLVAGTAQAYDSRCYVGGAPCHDGPESARNRWIGPSDEHRQLWERTVELAGVPSSVVLALNDFTLDVFAADDVVGVGTGQSIPTVTPVAFGDAERLRSRTMSAGEFAQLPDFGFSLWDWATGFETCPLDAALGAPARLDACHGFKTHMGAVNSKHFLPQAQAFYAYYHQLALGRAAACTAMKDRIVARGGRVDTFGSFLDACGREAFVLEAIAHHFLQDAWATGHMWERWGSPDLLDFTDLPQSLLIAMTSGLIHGARGV